MYSTLALAPCEFKDDLEHLMYLSAEIIGRFPCTILCAAGD